MELQITPQRIAPADRLRDIKEYYFSLKLREIRQRNAAGENILNLGIGNPDRMPPADAIKKLIESAVEPENHGYQPYTGVLEFRTALADWYGRTYGVSLNPNGEVLPLMGSKEGIFHISMAFLNPGDQVLVPNPGYPAYSATARMVGATVKEYELSQENGWLPDLKTLATQDLGQVKIMWVNYPHMPTGAVASQEVLQSIVDFGIQHNILIVNDNPYSLVTEQLPVSILSCKGAQDIALELNSLSKSFNMAGWRVGMVLGQKSYIDAILKVKSNMDSGMFLPIQHAAIAALETGYEWQTEVNEIYRKRRVLAWKILSTLGCSFDETQTGMFVWAKIPVGSVSSESFVDSVVDTHGIFITPGFIFGTKGEGYIRISLCSPEAILTEALNRILQLTPLAS